MGRRELRAELEATWSVYEPRVPGRPIRKKDLADADERAALGEPMSPGKPSPYGERTRESVNGTLQRSPSDLLVLGMLARGAK